MKKTSLYLTYEETAALRRLSASTGRSQAEIVREAIVEYAERHLGPRHLRSAAVGESDRGRRSSISEDIDEVMQGFGTK